MIETELRDALHARAEGVPVGVADPVARVITAVGADRRRRTTRGVAIVAALAARDGAAAQAAVRQHLAGTLTFVQQVRAMHPGWVQG